jgi:hypothetical protein
MNDFVRYILLGILIIVLFSCGGKDTVTEISKQELMNEVEISPEPELLPEFSNDEEVEGGLESEVLMNNAHMHDILQRIDPELQGQLGSWLLRYESLQVQVITDEKADRMRVIVPIVKVEDIKEDELLCLLQANFDSALDARYSVANGVVWSAFIHPLSVLSDEEFVSGFAQAVTAAATFGSTYSSGALIFRGGDSDEQQRKYYDSIIEKGLAI